MLRATVRLRNPREMELVLSGVVRQSVEQRRAGLCPPLSRTRVVYRKEPPGKEEWQSALETYERGWGDCEDLSCYFCADAILRGLKARVVVRRIIGGKMHAQVLVRLPSGRVVLVDPSKARGMGRRK